MGKVTFVLDEADAPSTEYSNIAFPMVTGDEVMMAFMMLDDGIGSAANVEGESREVPAKLKARILMTRQAAEDFYKSLGIALGKDRQ